jgi:hypothetical protein
LQIISKPQSAIMQLTTKLAFLAAIASVTAQSVSISDLPSCAVSLFQPFGQLNGILDLVVTNCVQKLAPAVAAIGTTGCGTNITCVCADSSFLATLTPKIQAACDAADFKSKFTCHSIT